jgi:hypothetical protein
MVRQRSVDTKVARNASPFDIDGFRNDGRLQTLRPPWLAINQITKDPWKLQNRGVGGRRWCPWFPSTRVNRPSAVGKRFCDGAEQSFRVEWLSEKPAIIGRGGARFDQIVTTRDENDRQLRSVIPNLLLQPKPIHRRHPYIRNQTIDLEQDFVPQKLRG